MEKSKFVKHRLPCHKCGGSDPVSLNNDGSAYCFSCSTFFQKYDEVNNENVVEFKAPKNTFLNSYTGTFNEITDRGIKK